jgi:hypothetical protein
MLLMHRARGAVAYDRPQEEGTVHRNPRTDATQPTVYQIRIQGHLGSQWTEWFGGLALTLEDNGDTLLTGPVADQAALHGLLKRVRDLGIPLISVSPVDADDTDASDAEGELGASSLER